MEQWFRNLSLAGPTPEFDSVGPRWRLRMCVSNILGVTDTAGQRPHLRPSDLEEMMIILSWKDKNLGR